MKLGVLLLSCCDAERVTDFDRAWAERAMAAVAGYVRDQSGGRQSLQVDVFDWYELPYTVREWSDFGFGAGPKVRPVVAQGLGVDLSSYTHFLLVIDVPGASLGANAPDRIYAHIAAVDFEPALICHEMGHQFGANHARLYTPESVIEYGNRFCVMGGEGSKYSFIDASLNVTRPDGTVDSSRSVSGPGMVATSLRACGWLDLATWGRDVTGPLRDRGEAEAIIAPLRGVPTGNPVGDQRVCAWADGVIGGKRILLEYRVRSEWDRALPAGGQGWVVAHQTGVEDRSGESIQLGSVAATPGAKLTIPHGQLEVSVAAASDQQVTLRFGIQRPAGITRGVPAVASWGRDRIDIVARGLDSALWHKAWAKGWLPGQAAWTPLGGGFTKPPEAVSWGRDRLDIFGIGLDGAMYHKAWANGGWHPDPAWEFLGGGFTSPPAVASWGPDRLDIFALGLDSAMWHKAWAQGWYPSQTDWESLGGLFTSPPAVAAWGPERLDIFGVGLDGAMYHKAWANGWHPHPAWEFLGGGFTSPPAVVSWGPDRLDIFAIGLDNAMWHKAWAQGWYPSQTGWESLGGLFTSPPAVAAWGPERLDIFGVGLDGGIYHKAWANGWHPHPAWEFLGGVFTSPPRVVSWGPDRLDIFGLGRDNGMWHKAWAQGWYPSQTEWESIGGGFL